MAEFMDALGSTSANFMQGLQGALQLAQRGKLLKAQAEQIKEQTALLKAKQTLQDAMTKEMSAAAQAAIGSPGVTPPAEGSFSGEAGPMAAAMQGGGGIPAAPREPQAPNLGPLFAAMIKYQPQEVGKHFMEQAFPKPTTPQRPLVLGPGQSAVNPQTGQPMYSMPAAPPKPERPLVVPPNATVMGPDLTPVYTAPPAPEKPKPFPPLPEMEYAAERKALPYDVTKPAEREALINRGLEAGVIPKDVKDAVTMGKREEVKAPTDAASPEAISQRDFRKPYDELTPEERPIVLARAKKEKLDMQIQYGMSRLRELRNIRTVNMLDTFDANRPVTVTVGQLLDADPRRYITQAGSTKALNAKALVEDIRGAITITRDSLRKLPGDFTASQAAQLSIALNAPNMPGALDAMFASTVGKTLTPEQIDYITNLAQLKENAMAMRSVLGAGQGSDEMRAAITATLPTPRTPTRAYAESALTKFEAQLNRLERGIINVPLPPERGTGGAEADPLGIRGMLPK